jgi:uncharacterized phiE125 gp8 family phage protein
LALDGNRIWFGLGAFNAAFRQQKGLTMPRTLIIAPESEPVTLDEAKAHLKVNLGDEDALITALITVSRQWAENFMGRAVLSQTWDYFLDGFASDCIELPLPPLISVTSVKYIDNNGATQTLATTEYEVDTAAEPGIVRLGFGKSWPGTRPKANAVIVRFVAGYAGVNSLPGPIKSACLLVIGELYERREHGIIASQVSVVPMSAEYLLWPYRMSML